MIFFIIENGIVVQKTKRCAEVTVKTLNTFLEENNQLKSELNMKDDLIRQLRIKLNEDWYNKWKKTIQQYSDVCEELVEVNKDYKKNRER